MSAVNSKALNHGIDQRLQLPLQVKHHKPFPHCMSLQSCLCLRSWYPLRTANTMYFAMVSNHIGSPALKAGKTKASCVADGNKMLSQGCDDKALQF